MVGRVGFEPTKAQGQQIYSLPRLTASVPTHDIELNSMEPSVGIEPTTYGLQNRCSTS